MCVGYEAALPFSIIFRKLFSDNKAALNVFVLIVVYIANVYSYIIFRYISDGSGKRKVLSDYPDTYPGILKDTAKIVRDEKMTFIAFFALAAFCWIFTCIDLAIFKNQRFLSVPVIFVFISIHFPVSLLPLSEKNIIGYLAGALILCIFYVVGLAVARKIWHSRRLHRREADIK